MTENVSIVRLDTGVPGLNEALGGGLPEYFLFDPAEKIRGKPEKIEIQRRIAEQGFLNQSRLDHEKGD